MMRNTTFGVLLLLGAMVSVGSRCAAADDPLPRIAANDNRVAAGTVKDGVLQLALEMRKGDWYPEAETGPHISVFAFAEAGKPPMVPGPLIRVGAGMKIQATVKNLLDMPMVLHGFVSRPGDDHPIEIAPGEQREVSFSAGAAGTYYYWAGNPSATLTAGAKRYGEESELSGAIVVDGPDSRPEERIFVLGLWRDYEDREKLTGLKEFGTINGKSWPYTERFDFHLGDEAVWHWINTSNAVHPMHMHGSYYEVLSRGDGSQDTSLKPELRPMVVTDLILPGRTMTMSWRPREAGHWLFHCHLMAHLAAKNSLSAITGVIHDHDQEQHSGMVGLVLALDVEGPPKIAAASYKQPRKLTLTIDPVASSPLQVAMHLRDGSHTSESDQLVGPPIVLHRGEPTEITVVNHLPEPTAIHWHGMELESYYDGVPGFTGMGKRMTPKIPPGGKFVARMTPPRAGTFIYHTHWHDVAQLRGGLNGALLVVDDNFHPKTDQLFIAAFGPSDDQPLILNGSHTPPAITWKSGETYRVRLINIGPNVPVRISFLSGGKPVRWTAVGKDGMELPPAQQAKGDAVQLLGVGETYDFLVEASAPGEMTARAFIPAAKGITPEFTTEQIIQVRDGNEPVAAVKH